MFNRNKFRAKLAEENCTNDKLASVLGINSVTLYRKIAGDSEFTRAEIQQSASFLRMTMQEVQDIFFAEELA